MFASKARAAEGFVLRDAGGLWGQAAKKAFYEPFTKETGIEITVATSGPDPLSQVKTMVDSKTYLWDCLNITVPAADTLTAQGYLEEIDWSGSTMSELIPQAHLKTLMGINVFATVFAYRTDAMKKAPRTWADFFDVAGFPGRRGMRKSPIDSLEQALLADGVPANKLYPLDVDRAFRKLDTIKKNVGLWWSGAAQSAQALSTGEVDICGMWNSRAQTSIEDKAPVKIVWEQALYGVEGWAILKGSPKAPLVQKFVKFCADPKRQAEYVGIVPFGPTNPNAYKYIDASRAALLPTAPAHFPRMIYQDPSYWGPNQEKLTERFNAWVLS